MQAVLRARERRHRIFLMTIGAVVLTWFAGYWALNAHEDSERKAAAARKHVRGERLWDADRLTYRHVKGAVDYPMTPPVGGDHDATWMTCDGTVHTRPIRNENAVHSLEHGAVWVTYNDTATATDIKELADTVTRTPYTMMSPITGQTATITLSAWGHQLSVDTASDPRVRQFITVYVQGPQTPEPGAPCTGGLTSRHFHGH
ncbi:DUF3105 domain-containing protein [Streptomyces sp. NPDC006235]|uniref:DUF3105 domain-containing protein n=1 Tax=Streptomyces sp. NPDC006235 TaxID=3156736 RepID=UPI0033A397E5